MGNRLIKRTKWNQAQRATHTAHGRDQSIDEWEKFHEERPRWKQAQENTAKILSRYAKSPNRRNGEMYARINEAAKKKHNEIYKETK